MKDCDGDSDSDASSRCRDDSQKTFPMSSVMMPSGKIVPVTVPARRCNCKEFSETRFVRLWRNGKMSRFENQFVWDEMHGSIETHDVSIGGDFKAYDIVTIHKLINCCVYTRFRNRMIDMEKEKVDVNQRMLFHGSAAVDDIIKKGFDERFSKTGGMFGAGVYFAKHSSKSNQYVYGIGGGTGCERHRDNSCYVCERKLLLCRVLLGTMAIKTRREQFPHAPPGFHSVVGTPSAGGLKYPEYIVYRGDQAYPEYLITYKLVKEKMDNPSPSSPTFNINNPLPFYTRWLDLEWGRYEGRLRKDGVFVFNYK